MLITGTSTVYKPVIKAAFACCGINNTYRCRETAINSTVPAIIPGKTKH
jgi:hypothetical protein